MGDTGAGKSTILEAITLGLYGNCTWTDGEHKELMAEGAAQMTVDFTFAHDGQRWRVRRVFHANTTPSTHLLENLDTGEHTDNARPSTARSRPCCSWTSTASRALSCSRKASSTGC